MKILLIDNYDSFTYNLVHLIEQLGPYRVEVKRNDKTELSEIEKFDKILLSPGPGIPENAGITKSVIREYGKNKSILGVCLGHQAIGEVFGNELENMKEVKHGICSKIRVDTGDYLFQGLPSEMEVGRYHSWVIHQANPLHHLEVIARDDDEQIMAVRHPEYDIRGVQFHPESILTPLGKNIMKNFLEHQQ